MLKGIKFKLRDVAKYERTKTEEKGRKVKFLELLEDVMDSVEGLVEAVKLGGHVSEEKAYDMIQLELDEGKELLDVQQDVIDAMRDSGFLGGVPNLKLREMMEKVDLDGEVKKKLETL